MLSKKDNINFIDIVILMVIHQNGGAATQRGLLGSAKVYDGLVNQWLESNGVDDFDYTSRLTSNLTIHNSVAKWRKFKFISEGKYEITSKGVEFLMKLPADWRYWPIQIPIVGNKLVIKEARYKEK